MLQAEKNFLEKILRAAIPEDSGPDIQDAKLCSSMVWKAPRDSGAELLTE